MTGLKSATPKQRSASRANWLMSTMRSDDPRSGSLLLFPRLSVNEADAGHQISHHK